MATNQQPHTNKAHAHGDASVAAGSAGSGIIVLKFGGSVLRDQRDVRLAAAEVARHVADGRRVVAVVSALEGVTDSLLGQAKAFGEYHDPHATALLLSTGELASAALLGLALTGAGITSQVLTPRQVGLRTTGQPLDSSATGLDADLVRASLRTHACVVVPGFVGVDEHGATTLLGRGGSDLTAIFIAQQLGCRCRLVKDVAGLYERDPNQPGPKPGRYLEVSWTHALSLGGGIVQPKAIAFARDHALTFEVGTHGRSDATVIGEAPDGNVLERREARAVVEV
jgi:homoserine dehydrogenase